MLRELLGTATSVTLAAFAMVPATVGPPAAAASPLPVSAGGPTAAGADEELAARHLAAERGIALAEARRRIEWQRLAPRLADEGAARLGDRFGGVWISSSDDRVKLGVVGDAGAATRSSVADAARRGIASAGLARAADLVAVRFPLDSLESGNLWLGDRIATVNAGATATLTAGLRTDINAIELQLPSNGTLTPAQSALVGEARQRLGEMLRVGTYAGTPTARACVYPYCDPPLRGGIEIFNSGRGCTGAFIARAKVGTALFQFTAGHCVTGSFGDDWSTLFTDNTVHVIGPRSNYRLGSQGDMAILRVNNPSGWQLPRAWVFVTAGPDTGRDETYHIAADSTSTIGMRICTTGAFYGRSDCGVVTQLGVTVSYDGVTVRQLGRGSFCGTAGDSGAPMYSGHVAYGLHVAGFSECDSLYQSIQGAEYYMGVNVLHGSS